MQRTVVLAAVVAVVSLALEARAQAQPGQPWDAQPGGELGQSPVREQATARQLTPRRSIVYAQAEAGYETLMLHTLRAVNQLPAEVESTASGTVYGVGGGVRLGLLTLGGRYRTSRFSGLDLSTVNGEVGLRFTIDRFEPYLLFGAGYARMSAHGQTLASTPDVGIRGVNGRAGFGIDYFPDPRISLGANVMGQALALTRPGFSATRNPQAQAESHLLACAEAPSLATQHSCAVGLLSNAEGSSYALGATFSLVMGLHF